jgi:hypothetical protein
MRLKKPLVTVTLSFADQKRVAMFYQILMNIDKRVNRSKPEQKKAKSKQRYEKISSPKKRAISYPQLCFFNSRTSHIHDHR